MKNMENKEIITGKENIEIRMPELVKLEYLKDMIYGCNNLDDENSTDSKPLKRLYNKVKLEMENEKNEK